MKTKTITRRRALAGLAAATAGPWLLNWPSQMLADVGKDTGAGHGLYLLVPKAERWQKYTQQFGDRGHSMTCDGKPAHGLLVWKTADEAVGLKNDTDVAALHSLTPDTIPQAGDSKKTGGKVAVQVGFDHWSKPPAAGTYRTREQIAADWTARLSAVPGVKIEVLASEPIPPNNVRVIRTNAPGQIQISFTGDECPAEILKLIKTEPQAYHIQWGGPQELFHCPPCGRG